MTDSDEQLTSIADAIADGNIYDLSYCGQPPDGPHGTVTDEEIRAALMANAINRALALGMFEMSPSL